MDNFKLLLLLVFAPDAAVGLDCEEPLSPDVCILRGYSTKNLPPHETPFPVFMDIEVAEVASVNDINLLVTTSVYIEMIWHDPRITFTSNDTNIDYLNLDLALLDRIFVPDLYIYSLISFQVPKLVKRSESLFLSRSGKFSFFIQGLLTTMCNMNFQKYPFDRQKCKVWMGSNTKPDSVMVFDGRLRYYDTSQRALQFNVNLNMIEEQDKIFATSGAWNFSVTGFEIHLERYKMPLVYQFFFPSAMFVVISWIGFILPLERGERTGMLVTLLLVLVSMFMAAVSSSPKAQTLTALETWFLSCIVFVLLAIVELGIVVKLTSCDQEECPDSTTSACFKKLRISPTGTCVGGIGKKIVDAEKSAKKIDKISLVVFPISFAVFVLAYFIKYSSV